MSLPPVGPAASATVYLDEAPAWHKNAVHAARRFFERTARGHRPSAVRRVGANGWVGWHVDRAWFADPTEPCDAYVDPAGDIVGFVAEGHPCVIIPADLADLPPVTVGFRVVLVRDEGTHHPRHRDACVFPAFYAVAYAVQGPPASRARALAPWGLDEAGLRAVLDAYTSVGTEGAAAVLRTLARAPDIADTVLVRGAV